MAFKVEDDVTNCQTETMVKCHDVTEGYVTKQECDEWLVQRCSIEKKQVKKYTPETKCHKEPTEICGPVGCGFKDVSIVCLLSPTYLLSLSAALRGLQGRGQDGGGGAPGGVLRRGAGEAVQARDQAGAPAGAQAGV